MIFICGSYIIFENKITQIYDKKVTKPIQNLEVIVLTSYTYICAISGKCVTSQKKSLILKQIKNHHILILIKSNKIVKNYKMSRL